MHEVCIVIKVSFSDCLGFKFRHRSGLNSLIHYIVTDVLFSVLAFLQAQFVSDGDLVSSALRSRNDWSLATSHAVMSTLAPAYLMSGSTHIMFPSCVDRCDKPLSFVLAVTSELYKSPYVRCLEGSVASHHTKSHAVMSTLAPGYFMSRSTRMMFLLSVYG